MLDSFNINQEHRTGPFDIIGDVHGCYDELKALLRKLGYQITEGGRDYPRDIHLNHPEGRTVVFVGDLVDRGPNSPEVLELVMNAVLDEKALCVMGNHDDIMIGYMSGAHDHLMHGLEGTVRQLEETHHDFSDKVLLFFSHVPHHIVLDGERLVVVHAAIKEDMIGKDNAGIRQFCVYGDLIPQDGRMVRRNWGKSYRGTAKVVHGHVVLKRSEWLGNTLDIDNGCVYGNQLTALRYPENNLVSVPAEKTYYEKTSGFKLADW